MKILVADDHLLFRAGVIQALRKYPDCAVIAEAENGNEALRNVIDFQPDIAIFDVRMPDKSGLEVLTSIAATRCATKVVLLTIYRNPNYFYQAVTLGAKGYLLKEDAVAEIIKAVVAISRGRSYISLSLSKLLKGKEKSSEEVRNTISDLSTLTKMEREVLTLVDKWKTNQEIADLLFISPRTAGNHRTNISSKLGLHGTHSLIKFALENKDLFS